jgi:hypothetical protein
MKYWILSLNQNSEWKANEAVCYSDGDSTEIFLGEILMLNTSGDLSYPTLEGPIHTIIYINYVYHIKCHSSNLDGIISLHPSFSPPLVLLHPLTWASSLKFQRQGEVDLIYSAWHILSASIQFSLKTYVTGICSIVIICYLVEPTKNHWLFSHLATALKCLPLLAENPKMERGVSKWYRDKDHRTVD